MTARDVVADYLRAKQEQERPLEQKEIVAERAGEVIAELPDGFTVKDVRVCVGLLCDGDPDLEGLSNGRRARAVTAKLNAMVADGELKLDGDQYAHTTPF
jgi:hypothetical protein